MIDTPKQFIVIFTSAWMNETGFGFHHSWDRERFDTRARAIAHGLHTIGSDDFNIGEVIGNSLTWFGWMDGPIDEDDATMAEIAEEIGLSFDRKAA